MRKKDNIIPLKSKNGQKTEKKKKVQDKRQEWKGGTAGKWIAISCILLVIACFLAAYLYVMKVYTVTTVYVEGNVHYTNEEVMDMVMGDSLGKNSLYLSFKYRDRDVANIPFVESMDVTIVSPDTIRISVYEKALAGYVEYLGRYMYFDKDGIIVENSDTKTAGIPQVTGLDFGYVVMYQKLPVENDEIFHKILDITQLLAKYNISADKLYFDPQYEVTLYFDKVRVKIGTTDKIDEKIMKLQYILPEVEGKSGVFRMENYTEESKNITFELD